MLYTHKTSALVDTPTAVAEGISPADIFASFSNFVRRQSWTIVFVAVLMIALGILYVVTAPRSFTAQATTMIDARKAQLFQLQPTMSDAASDSTVMASEVEVLSSENIALAVIKKLHLADDPEFVGPNGGLVPSLNRLVADLFGLKDAPRSDSDLTQQAVNSFKSRLNVKRVGLTYAIEISFRSLNPERAAQIANAVTDAYVVDLLEAQSQAARRASAWLQDQIRELRDQASAAERAVVEFKTTNNIVSIGPEAGGRLMDEQRVMELDSQLVAARAQLSEAEARLDRIEALLHANSPELTVDATVADSLKNEVVTKLRTQYLEMANREADWSARYGRDHLAAVNLRNQMKEIRNLIFDELRRTAESYKSDYEIAKQREAAAQKYLAQAVFQTQVTNRAQARLHELESNAHTYRSLYDNSLQHYMESVQQQSFPISQAHVITAARPPTEPSHPKTLLILVATAMGGVILGLAVAWLRDSSERVFRTTDQVRTRLQIDCIAVLPKLPELAPLQSAPGSQSEHVAVEPRAIARSSSLLWSVRDSPFSRFTESMRSIKMAATLSRTSGPIKVIGVTSTFPNEGKSTIAASLAQLIAQAGSRTLLVDGDLRNPGLSRVLAPHAPAGLLDLVAGTAALDDVVWTERSTSLQFLPANLKSTLAGTSEILASDAAKRLFDSLRETFDYIVVDLSPLAPIIDARATAHLVDSYLFVIEWGHTNVDVVERALNDARMIYDNMLGAVLNKADLRALGRYEHCHGYYHNKHYNRYGYTE